jgi:hypothetical protein
MAEQKQVCSSKLMALPPLQMVLSDPAMPDPFLRRKEDLNAGSQKRDMEGTVRRLIAHLKDEK